MNEALAPLTYTLLSWDDVSQAEVEALGGADGAAGRVPLLVIIEADGVRVVSPFARELTASLLVGAGVELRKGGLN